MRLTTKGRFAVTAMIDLALRHGKGPVTLSAISERQEISLSYLEQLFGKLRRHHIVESVRGPGGGYNLGRSPDKVTVADIIIAVDEPIDATQCGGKQNCLGKEKPGKAQCMTGSGAESPWQLAGGEIDTMDAPRRGQRCRRIDADHRIEAHPIRHQT